MLYSCRAIKDPRVKEGGERPKSLLACLLLLVDTSFFDDFLFLFVSEKLCGGGRFDQRFARFSRFVTQNEFLVASQNAMCIAPSSTSRVHVPATRQEGAENILITRD